MKLICYGVRQIEQEFFHQLNQYNYELTLIPEHLNHETVELAKGHDAIMMRGNCLANRQVLTKIHDFSIKYILTRTVGYNHIDLDVARQLDLQLCARVPFYSPTAISELAVSMALMLYRKTLSITNHTSKKDFTIYPHYFAREIRSSTVGIIGMGRIGQYSAKAFLGMGAKVLGVDVLPSEEAKNLLSIVDMDTLLQESDIILLHLPYFKDKNYHLVNSQFISKMKNNSVLINVSRGELVNIQAVIEGLQSNKLLGVGLDVLENEQAYFGKNCFDKDDSLLNIMTELYPRLILTPHLGSFTDEALTNMIEISYNNLHNFISTGDKPNCLL